MRRPRAEADFDWYDDDEFQPVAPLTDEDDEDAGGVTVVGPEGPEAE